MSEITVENLGEKALIRINGSIGETGAEEMKRRFHDLDLNKIKEVVVDLGGVEAMGSSAIGKLLLFYKHLGINNGTLRVENMAPSLYELFSELKLDKLFTITRR